MRHQDREKADEQMHIDAYHRDFLPPTQANPKWRSTDQLDAINFLKPYLQLCPFKAQLLQWSCDGGTCAYLLHTVMAQ